MLESVFSFYRGTAAIMAADLGYAPSTDLDVVSCGDAHISNFGFYASPERELVFDLNDFDEGGVAPWEWDGKRLATSVYIGGRDNAFTEEECQAATLNAIRAYQGSLREYCRLPAIERYFTRVDTSAIADRLGKKGRKTLNKVTTKARGRTSEQVLRKLATQTEGGEMWIVDQPPVLRHVAHANQEQIDNLFRQYRSSVRADVAFLLEQYRLVDFALRVVGVGSDGTRCYLLALQGPTGDSLFLQAKEAPPSVLTSHGGRPAVIPGEAVESAHSEGRRVVAAQQILQANSDPFLGWIEGFAGDREGRPRVDYYWRQFRDMKGSIDPGSLDIREFTAYTRLCTELLARAHGQSPNARAIADYLGKNDTAATALASWAQQYADVAQADYDLFAEAVASGRIPAERGI